MRKILVVDDTRLNREILKKILEKDYETIEAENGEEALGIMHRSYKILSAIVLDLLMPVMDGYEVLKKMRDNVALSQIPVIVITGSEDEEARVKALALGANDFVTKPYNPDIIKHCLRNSINLRETASIVNAIQRDKLTGIYSREAFFDKAYEMIKNSQPGSYIMTCFDIDNFKLVNDQYGAPEGDRILKHIGKTARKSFEAIGGICGRISGDNFAGIFPNTREAADYITAARINEFLPPDAHTNMTFSVGRYVISDITLTASAMYDRSYIAKQSVKGMYDKHVAYFDEVMLYTLVQEQQITSEMDAALRDNQFEVWFQPQVNYATGAMIGAEALVRWRHPKRGLISPGVFIPLFEQNGFIYELDKFVWRRTCQYLRKWIDEARNPLPVSVNISRCDIFREDLVSTICGFVKEFSLPVNLLRLEVTESAFEKSTGQIVEVVKSLMNFGFMVEIDDFGSGYSSLNTLKDVPANILKLDMKFLDDSGELGKGGNILESIVRMAKWIGMSVIAEGVERPEQAVFLRSIGCNYIQGYLYARPMPVHEYEAFANNVSKEEKMLTLETVEHLDNSSFWNPDSMDTLIFNSYVGGACIIEYHDGIAELIRANEKLVREIGQEHSPGTQVLGIELAQYLDEDNKKTVHNCIIKAVETGTETDCEIKLARVDGDQSKFIYLLATARMVARCGNRFLMYCTVRNITERCVATNNLEKINKMLKLLTDSIPGGIATYACSDKGIKVTYYNDGFCETLGYTRGEYEKISNKSASSRVFKEDFPLILQNLEKLKKTGEPIECTYRIHTKDGGFKWLKHRAAIIDRKNDTVNVNSVFFDVTKEYETLENLRMREEEYRIAMIESGSMICRFTLADKAFSMSPEVAEYFCVPEVLYDAPYEVVRKGLVAPESVKPFIAFYEEILSGEKNGKAVFERMTVRGLRWIEAQYYTIFSDDKIPVSAVISYIDITEKMEKESIYKRWQQSLDERDDNSYTLFRCNLSKNASCDSKNGNLINLDLTDEEISFDERTHEYVEKYVSEGDREVYLALMKSDSLLANYYRGKHSHMLEYREKIPDGGTKWIRLTIDMVEYSNSSDIEVFLMYENIDAAKKAESLTVELSRTDSLTGVLNRTFFSSELEAVIASSLPGAMHALLMLDIDGFKTVNDVFGHATGDQALIDLSKQIKSLLRPNDLIGRLGGDEFLVFLSNIPDEASALSISRSICSNTRKSFSAEVNISVSIGISICPADGSDFKTLYKKADCALYHVKGSGKDNCMVYRDELKNENLETEVELYGKDGKAPGVLKKRMLIVDDNQLDCDMLSNIFKDDFIIDFALDGNAALIRLRHYGAAVSVVLLDLMMPGMSGFDVLKKMQLNTEMKSIPVIVVSGDDDRESSIEAIRCGAADFVNKPVDSELLRIRVLSAVSRAENERLRIQNNCLLLENDVIERYRTVLRHTGIAVIENDWVRGTFSYDPEVSSHIAGVYDGRKLWHILLSDMVADTDTVHKMQEFLRNVAEDRKCSEKVLLVQLKTPSRIKHWFRLSVYKKKNEFGLTNKLILAFLDIGNTQESE